jgi:hypothetical protein
MAQWATEFADSKGAAAWAHLSDSLAGIKALKRNGFEEVNTVIVDLDEYATKGTDKPWGHYSHHCMYRPPHAASTGYEMRREDRDRIYQDSDSGWILAACLARSALGIWSCCGGSCFLRFIRG